VRAAAVIGVIAVAVIAASVVAGAVSARLIGPTVHGRYFLWVSGRAMGIAAYLALTALTVLGTWLRHPWRTRAGGLHGETRLRVHAALGVATLALVMGHLATLAADRYAGVGWIGAFVPGRSQYRTAAVAIGVVAMYVLSILVLSASLAGRRGTAHWHVVHRFASLTFVAVWLHGVLAGTDALALRLLYGVTGAVWVAVVTTRLMARRVDRRVFDVGQGEHGTLPRATAAAGEPGSVARARVPSAEGRGGWA
jgi:methionine sulfoxide reductase heme-binding subunit